MRIENPLIRHPFGKLMSLSGIEGKEVQKNIPRLNHPDIANEYAGQFALNISRLGNKLIDVFEKKLDTTVILTMMRGGLYTGIDLSSFIKSKTEIEIPVEGIHVLHKESSGLRNTTAWLTAREILRKYPDAKNYFLVDGWIGTGMSIKMTKLMLNFAFADLGDTKDIKVSSISPIDPIGICDYSLRRDLVNPYHLEDNDSLGISKPRFVNGVPVSEINTSTDSAAILEPIEDFNLRAYLEKSPYYLNPKPNDLPNLGQNGWGLGFNEALNRAQGDHIIITTPPVIPLLKRLDMPYIQGPDLLPYNWLAISVPRTDISNQNI